MKIFKITLVLLGIIFSGSIARSQGNNKSMPNDQAWLQKFAGKWTGTISVTDDKKQTTSINSQMTWTPVAGGKGLSGSEDLTDPKGNKMNYTYLMGYDPYEKKIHLFAVSDGDICHDHSVTWKSENEMYIEHKSNRNGKIYMEKLDLVFKDKDTLEMTENDYLDGKLTETDKGTMKRSH